MRILFLSDDFPPQSYGGAGIIACNLGKAFLDQGHSVSVITTVRSKAEEGESVYEGMRILKLYSDYHPRWRAYRSLYNHQVIRKIAKILETEKPDIVHAHNVHYHISYHSLRIAERSGARVILTTHDTMLFNYGKSGGEGHKKSILQQLRQQRLRYNPLRNIIIRYYLRYVSKIVAVSSALRDALVANGIKNVEVVHNGIDVRDWEASSQSVSSFRKEYSLDGKPVVLFGGRLSEAKGGHQAIRAMKKIRQSHNDATLLVVGEKNEYIKEMVNLAERIGISDSVVFTGWISGASLKAAYHTSDIVLVPSIYLDPFPTVNLEAMACGKPIIGTCYGGTVEIVVDGETGYVINPLHPEEIAEKAIDLLTRPRKAHAFGEAGYRRVESEFSIDKSAKAYLDIFEKYTTVRSNGEN